jgi:hypothetical protein
MAQDTLKLVIDKLVAKDLQDTSGTFMGVTVDAQDPLVRIKLTNGVFFDTQRFGTITTA